MVKIIQYGNKPRYIIFLSANIVEDVKKKNPGNW